MCGFPKVSTRICPFPSCVKTSVEAARPPTRRSPASLRRNGGPCMVALPIPAAPLDNLINLVSPSLPTFFAPATKFLLCPVNPRSPALLAFLPPSLSHSLFLSLRFLFARQPPLICITGSMDPSSRRDRYRVSVDGDGGTRIAIQAGVTIPNSFDIGRASPSPER